MEHFHERALPPSSTVIFVKTFQYSYADYTQHRHAIAVPCESLLTWPVVIKSRCTITGICVWGLCRVKRI